MNGSNDNRGLTIRRINFIFSGNAKEWRCIVVLALLAFLFSFRRKENE